MLVKIRRATGEWELIDRVSRFRYSEVPKTVRTLEELRSLVHADSADVQSAWFLKNSQISSPVQVSIIEFQRDGMQYVIAFDEVAFLLNNDGKTLEKVPQWPRNQKKS